MLSLWIAIISFVLAAGTFLLPVAHTATNAFATHWRAAVATLIFVLYIGSATSFLSGLKSFTRNLRVAYRLIALGILAFGVVWIQLVVWGLLDMWDSAWATSGSGLVPFIFTCAFIYFGARKFANVVGVKSVVCSFWLVTVMTLVVGVLTYLAAIHFVQYSLEGVEIYITVCAICSSYLFFAGLAIFKIYKSIGAYYKSAMGWLAVGTLGLSAAAAHEAINTFWFNNGDAYTDYGYYLIPWIFVGFLLLRASYAFRLLPIQSEQVQAAPAKPSDKQQAPVELPAGDLSSSDYIDSILNIVTLVARPTEVDPILDDMRVITSNLTPGQELSASDREKLIGTYNKVEKYLLEKDPMQTFTTADIRSHCTAAFRTLINKRIEQQVKQGR